ncbi:hypothetical protein PCASD_11732 [Puccinia coronata f. sp. avenae]|uniref:Uncharacterized protein n=1 Tax=Puccinia coronata f. sp. avenae TaxID=200324 RepID=A0A2N5UMH6_9BASI|nr:hypothetical protein PCASD_11732 [Puccinia coronata f. sp. avenae]
MGFVKYDRNLKVIAIKMSRRGMTLAEINVTCDVVRNPVLYLPRGWPLAFTTKQHKFVLAALEAEPALYSDKIQSHIVAMTGVQHPLWTILDELKI